MRTAFALSLLAVLTLTVAVVAGPPLPTEPAAPPPPEKYDATIRYSIANPSQDRVPRFRTMLAFFKKQGFTRDEERAPEDEEENPAYAIMSGTVPSAKARRLLLDRNVRAIRLIPAGTPLPPADALVRVQLELAAGPMTDPGRHLYHTSEVRQSEMDGGPLLVRQRAFAEQVRAVLGSLGFSEAVAYDNRAHTRLLGSIPAGKLNALLDDLRIQPAAWKLPNDPPIDSVLLAGLRRRRGGEAALEGILRDWDDYFEKKKKSADYRPEDDVIAKMVAAWEKERPAADYLKGLPPDVVRSDIIRRGLLLAHAAAHSDSGRVLDGLWRDVLSNPFAPDLLALMMRRLPSSVLGDLPLLLRTDSPIRVTEVQPNLPLSSLRQPPVLAKGDEKLSPELRSLLAAGGDLTDPRRLEVLLAFTPDDSDRSWRRELGRAAPSWYKLTASAMDTLRAAGMSPAALEKLKALQNKKFETRDDMLKELAGALDKNELESYGELVLVVSAPPGIVIEGRIGPLVSLLMPPSEARALAGLAIVSGVRLPHSGEPRSQGALPEKIDSADALRTSGLQRLHEAGIKGKGVRLAIIDGDFRGWRQRVGKGLPARTRLLDLTAERNDDLFPDAPLTGAGIGHGTHIALAAAVAAPEADLLLIRIDPAAPYQLMTLARAMNGERHGSLNLARRANELEELRGDIASRRSALRKARAAQMEKAPDLSQKRLLLRKKEKVGLTADEEDQLNAILEFEAYKQEQAHLEAEDREFRARERRYLALEDSLRDLRTVRVVATGLSWTDGMPVDGGGVLGRYFDDEPFRNALWFQAVGDTRGQAWVGLFRDRGGAGVMDFVPVGSHLPPQRWGPSLAFLSWQPAAGAAVADIPANTTLRLTIQWREPHDPQFQYRQPLASPRLVLLRQVDPTGTKQPADDFQVVSESVGLPQQLDNQPNSAVYEQTVEVKLTQAGRYALRVEGSVPASIRPPGVPTLPANEKTWELRPRLFIDTLSGAGRVVLTDFAIAEGGIGTPADARGPIAVGAADAAGKPLPSSAFGSAFGMELLPKPAVLSPAVSVVAGPASETSLATGFAAGLAAAAISGGAPTEKFLRSMGTASGTALRVPQDWPRRR